MVRLDIAEHYRHVYTAGAADYDRSRFGSLRGGFAKRLKNEQVLAVLRRRGLLAPGARILDLATGTGRIAHDLLREPVGRVVGADLTRAMLVENRSGAPDPGRLGLVQADMRRLALPDASFDAVTVGSFFYLVPEAEYAAFTEDVHRVLRPGGLLVAEIANALTLFNPRTLVKIARHRRRNAVKSFVLPWRLRRAFPRFDLVDAVGVEYPLVGRRYGFYRFVNRLLGRLPLVRWTGGKVIAVLRKPCS